MLGLSEDQKTVKMSLKAKVVKKGTSDCKGCYFESMRSCDRMYCTSSERKDKRYIIWVED